MKDDASNPKCVLTHVDQYLLGDESLDRPSFELQMQEDPDLALQVASRLEQLELMAIAASQLESTAVLERGNSWSAISFRRIGAALCASAALVLLLIGANNWQSQKEQDLAIERVAASWVALGESEGNFIEDFQIVESFDEGELGSGEEDWIVDAVSQMYSEVDI